MKYSYQVCKETLEKMLDSLDGAYTEDQLVATLRFLLSSNDKDCDPIASIDAGVDDMPEA